MSRRARIILAAVVALIVLIVVLSALVGVYVNWLWFGSVGYRSLYSTVLGTRLLLFFVFGIAMALIVGANLYVAFRMRPPFQPMSAEQHNLERYRMMIEPRRGLILAIVSIVMGLFAGASAQGRWQTWLLWRNGTPFGQTDPQFHKDISYFTFTYPFQRYVVGFLFIAIVLSLVGAAVVHYLFGSIRIQTPGEKVLPGARAHLSVLIGLFVLLKAVAYYLDRYGLVFSTRGVVTGASYTDVNAVLPAKVILVFVALICAIAFIANVFVRNFALPAIALVLLIFSSVVIGGIYPAIVQQFSVKPNQNQKEKTYIERNIKATRAAYNITDKTVTYKDYNATTSTSPAERRRIANDKGTVPNARLLDPNILSPTFDQNQRIRSYFGFNKKLDIDRYLVNGKEQDYVVGVRELDPSKLTGNQRNWINEHLTYTHGNGMVLAPADQVQGGRPEYAVQGLPPTGPIRIDQSRVYFGELFGNDYAIVGKTKGEPDREFDLPGEGNKDVKTTYNGKGGVPIGSYFNRLIFALKYKEQKFLLSGAINANSRLIYIRDPRQMVEKAAPFLKVDGDPYPAIVDGRITWILDGYTTSDGYPYAKRETLGEVTQDSLTGHGTAGQPNQQVNYIRNSVKATVDAYTGEVKLYQWDTQDPVLKTWMKAFPGVIKPKSDITRSLREHFRYPEDLFKVQRELMASYHVSDPGEFYNQQNFWQVPNDPTQPNSQPQPPYYLLAQGPGQSRPTFQLTSVMNFQQRENMAAYITVSCDPGTSYGHIQVLQLPSSTSVLGPGQVQSTLRSTDVISKDLSLFNSNQSSVLYGNLLTLPVADGLLYVEPLYVQGSGSSYPLLRRVLVAFGNNVGYASTLNQALKNLFTGQNQSIGGNNGSGGNSTSPPPSSTPSPGSGTSAAVDAIRRAITELQNAYKSGDLARIGQAQADLKRAIDQFDKAQSSGSGSGGSGSGGSGSGSQPTRSPSSGGRGG